jgi:beta-N-acetylhexosaminidase
VANALKQGRIGGVLLRRANIENPAQLKALTTFLADGQAQAPLILIEHSGGSDHALAQAAGFQPIASPREVGARGDALEAFDIYQQMAEGLAAAGVSLNVGPSASACGVDASAATMDCFGSDSRNSAAFATAFNLAHQRQGVLTAMRYQASVGGDAALNEMAKRKAPDALVVSAQSASSQPGARTANMLRPAGYSGAILLDSFDEPDAAEKLVDALNHGADMVLFRAASALEAGLPETGLAGIRSAIGAGRLAQARLDDAGSHAALLRQQVQTSQSRIASRAGLADQSSPAR